MPTDPITCHCDEGCGLPHIHRNPPYDTDGRNELHRKMRDQRVPEPRTPMPLFKDEEADSTTPATKAEESQCDRPAEVESCDIGSSRSCEKQDGPGENSCAPEAIEVEDHKNDGLCGEKGARGKGADAQATIKLEEPND